VFRWKFWSVMLECEHCFTLALPEYLLPSIWVPKTGDGFTDFTYIYPKYIVRRSFFSFLDAFAKLRKSTSSFVMSANCLVCPHGTTQLPRDGFSRNFLFEIFFWKICCNKSSFKVNEHLTWRSMNNSDKISLNSSWNKLCYRQNL